MTASPHSPAPPPDPDGRAQPRRRFTRSETARAEAFSDGVFAIAVTIIVLELTDPPHRPGHLGGALLHLWPGYLGYLASFSYVGVIWLNHHQAFVRIRAMDRGLHAANLGLLFTTAALAFPTSVVSSALQEDVFGRDAKVSVALYAVVAALMCLSWVWLYSWLRHHPELLDPAVEREYVPHGQLRSVIGAVAYLAAGALGLFTTPLVAFAVFLVLPVFYFFTSEGFVGRAPEAAGAGVDG